MTITKITDFNNENVSVSYIENQVDDEGYIWESLKVEMYCGEIYEITCDGAYWIRIVGAIPHQKNATVGYVILPIETIVMLPIDEKKFDRLQCVLIEDYKDETMRYQIWVHKSLMKRLKIKQIQTDRIWDCEKSEYVSVKKERKSRT